MFASHGDQIGLAKLVQGHRNSTADGNYIPTKGEGRKSIKLRANEIVLQVKLHKSNKNLSLCEELSKHFLSTFGISTEGAAKENFLIYFVWMVHVHTRGISFKLDKGMMKKKGYPQKNMKHV